MVVWECSLKHTAKVGASLIKYLGD
jgi:G:T-mismatch repair DNA endonuclease (very short patch repair protein)